MTYRPRSRSSGCWNRALLHAASSEPTARIRHLHRRAEGGEESSLAVPTTPTTSTTVGHACHGQVARRAAAATRLSIRPQPSHVSSRRAPYRAPTSRPSAAPVALRHILPLRRRRHLRALVVPLRRLHAHPVRAQVLLSRQRQAPRRHLRHLRHLRLHLCQRLDVSTTLRTSIAASDAWRGWDMTAAKPRCMATRPPTSHVSSRRVPCHAATSRPSVAPAPRHCHRRPRRRHSPHRPAPPARHTSQRSRLASRSTVINHPSTSSTSSLALQRGWACNPR